MHTVKEESQRLQMPSTMNGTVALARKEISERSIKEQLSHSGLRQSRSHGGVFHEEESMQSIVGKAICGEK